MLEPSEVSLLLRKRSPGHSLLLLALRVPCSGEKCVLSAFLAPLPAAKSDSSALVPDCLDRE